VLPDNIFSNQKSQLGYILEDLAMVDVGVLGHFVYLHILRPNGIFYAHLVPFAVIW
jgi:hypothetical protein